MDRNSFIFLPIADRVDDKDVDDNWYCPTYVTPTVFVAKTHRVRRLAVLTSSHRRGSMQNALNIIRYRDINAL